MALYLPENRYLPQRHQPINAFFNIEIGGKTRIFDPPDIPLDFSIAIGATGITTHINMTFFDQSGEEIEPYIWKSAQMNEEGMARGTLRWGVLGDTIQVSDVYPFEAPDYVIDVQDNCFALRIVAAMAMGPHMSVGKLHGTVEEIIDDFCSVHGYQKKIDPAFGINYMLDVGYIGKDTTDKRELQYQKAADEPDWAFLRRIIPFARDGENRGGYRIMEDVDKDGQKMLRIYRPDDSDADYVFKVQDPDSTVIRWKPNINFTAVTWGASGNHWNYIQRGTGNLAKVTPAPNLTFDQQTTFGYRYYPKVRSLPIQPDPSQLHHMNSESMEKPVVSGCIRGRNKGTSSAYACGPEIHQQLIEWSQFFGAELTVLGDPAIKPGRNCRVDFYYPFNYKEASTEGKQHYSAGMYHIDEVVHSISGGLYETTLLLSRPTAPEMEIFL